MRIALERFTHAQRQAVETLPHIRMTSRQPHPHESSPTQNVDDSTQRLGIDVAANAHSAIATQLNHHRAVTLARLCRHRFPLVGYMIGTKVEAVAATGASDNSPFIA
jgi:hypothetical protein